MLYILIMCAVTPTPGTGFSILYENVVYINNVSSSLLLSLHPRSPPIHRLRETNVLLALHHPNIVNVREMVTGRKKDHVFMVMEYMPHDLRAFMDHLGKIDQISQ